MSAMGDLARQDLENRLRPRVSPKRRSLTYIPRSRKRSEPVNSSSATHLSFPFRLQPARAKSREAWKRHLRPSLWCISQSIGRAAYVCTVYGRASLYIYISIYVYIYIHIYIYIYIYIYIGAKTPAVRIEPSHGHAVMGLSISWRRDGTRRPYFNGKKPPVSWRSEGSREIQQLEPLRGYTVTELRLSSARGARVRPVIKCI